MTELNTKQLLTLLQSAQKLDALANGLPEGQRNALISFEKRAGDAYAAGNWQLEKTGEQYSVAERSAPPTREEAQQVLGQAYLTLSTQKDALRGLMNDMGLNPSAKQSWIGKVVGMFR